MWVYRVHKKIYNVDMLSSEGQIPGERDNSVATVD